MQYRASRLLTFIIFSLYIWPAPPVLAKTQVSVGSATTISKFNDLTYQHVSLIFPLASTAWAPTALVAGIGVFELDDDSATAYTLGPAWRWDIAGQPNWYVDAGIAFAYLEKPRFRRGGGGSAEDFGMHIEFISHLALGLYLDRTQHWSVEAGFMHVSNGGLDETNPGADLFGVDLRFGY